MRILDYITTKSQRRHKVRKDINILCSGVKILLFAYFAIVMPDYGICQSVTTDNSPTNHQLWLDIYPHFYVSEKLEYYGDAGYRTLLNENIWHWFYGRPSVRYHLNKRWELHGGVGFFYVYNKAVSDRFEIRPWQGIRLSWPRFKKLGFKHYVRFEERISFLTHDWSSSLALRLRYKLSCRWDFIKINNERFWFIPLYGEVFFPIGDEVKEFFRNRGRAGVGLGYNVSASWRFSLNINWQTSRTGVEEDYTVSDYIYQIKISKLWGE